jgi:hypothetical protein
MRVVAIDDADGMPDVGAVPIDPVPGGILTEPVAPGQVNDGRRGRLNGRRRNRNRREFPCWRIHRWKWSHVAGRRGDRLIRRRHPHLHAMRAAEGTHREADHNASHQRGRYPPPLHRSPRCMRYPLPRAAIGPPGSWSDTQLRVRGAAGEERSVSGPVCYSPPASTRVTAPWVPLTRTRSPSASEERAPCTAITAGMPTSRAVTAPWLSGPPLSVTTATAE